MKTLIILSICLLGTSCGGSTFTELDYVFKGDFDPELADQVAAYLADFGRERGYNLYEKDREQMKALSQGQSAFYISYYIDDDELPVFSASNVGSGTVLTLMFISLGSNNAGKVDVLVAPITTHLRTEFNIDMNLVSQRSKDI